ncbi:MAG: cyclic nucleotide-binding domain-containing protein, partial [Tenuifilaceae bacterium]|nr:cyclic nucleotide-binding domain-containing protein [Tenuifilaceae bacterium]
MVNENVLAFLEKIELFRGLNADEFQLLVKSVKENTYKPNELLFRENGPREDIFIIYEGEVELFKSSAYGVELKLTYFGKGDFL